MGEAAECPECKTVIYIKTNPYLLTMDLQCPKCKTVFAFSLEKQDGKPIAKAIITNEDKLCDC
jgi:phage FluMu protein Com